MQETEDISYIYEKFEEQYIKGDSNEVKQTSIITEVLKQYKPGKKQVFNIKE